MAPTTSAPLLRLDHAELCHACNDLLQTGTAVVVEAPGRVTCLACAASTTALRLVPTDAWSVLDDGELRRRLAERRQGTGRRYAISA